MRVLKIVSIVGLLVCLPLVGFAGPLVNFEDETTGTSVEDLGAIHPMLNIQATPDAVVIETFTGPKAYGAPSPANTSNACLEDADGNRVHDGSGTTAKGFGSPQESAPFDDWSYDFSFAGGKTVSAFAIRVFDVGDYNPSLATDHSVSLMAYDAMANLVDSDEITFTTPAAGNPTSSDPYGNLLYGAGDACDATFGQPGYFELSVGSPTGIATVELRSTGQDPKVGFDSIDFTPCTRTIGYWKNHEWPTAVYVGADELIAEADGSVKDAEAKEDKGILWNATGKNFSMLCAQLIAAKLNCYGGDCVPGGVIDAADGLLVSEGVFCTEPGTWDFGGKTVKRQAASIASELDAFNNNYECVESDSVLY